MKGVRTVSYDELSPEQMEAARRRRRIELSRDSTSLDLEDVELPENHPFAVKQNLSKGMLLFRKALCHRVSCNMW